MLSSLIKKYYVNFLLLTHVIKRKRSKSLRVRNFYQRAWDSIFINRNISLLNSKYYTDLSDIGFHDVMCDMVKK